MAAPASPPDDGADTDLERRQTALEFVVDVFMLALIIANLTLIIFDWMFLNPSFRSFLQWVSTDFYTFYDTNIHAHFFLIDLAFVSVFVTEIVIRWGLAIKRQTYDKWWFYPIVHWYDVIGCIPVDSLRALRVLRIFAMIPKMQRLGIIDLTQTIFYDKYAKYRDIVTEEITDRVILQILDGVQDGVRSHHPVTDRIVKEVVAPREKEIMNAIAHRIQEATASSYAPNRERFREYIDERVAEAVEANQEITTIARIPGVGRSISDLLERAISDIVFSILDDILHDVTSLENDEVISRVATSSTHALLSPRYDRRLDHLLQEMVGESFELIKDQVSVKQWKIKELQEREHRRAQRARSDESSA